MWSQWPIAALPAVPPQPSAPPPLPDAPPPPPPVDSTPSVGTGRVVPTVVPGSSAGSYMGTTSAQQSATTNPYEQYTAAQYAAMTPEQQYALQQHWQQWQTYQQEYAKWHAQYGEQYKREMAAAAVNPAVNHAVPAVVTTAQVAAASSVPAIGPVYPQAAMVQPPMRQMQPQAYYPQVTPLQQTQLPGKIVAQPQMYHQPPPPPPQIYEQHPQGSQKQPHQNQWQQQPPAGRFNQMPPVVYHQPPNSDAPGDSGMFPNLLQPPPSSMQQRQSKGNDRGNINAPEQRTRWSDGPTPDAVQQLARNSRWQCNEPGNINTSNININNNKPNQFGNQRSWSNAQPDNNIKSCSNPFISEASGHSRSDDGCPPRGGLDSGNFDDVPGPAPGSGNSGNFGRSISGAGGGRGNFVSNFVNNGLGKGPVDNFGPANFGNNNRRNGRWEPNRQNQSGGSFGPPQMNNNNNSFNDGYNRGPNQQGYNQQQIKQQQRGPEMDEASFDHLFNQWEKQFEDWKRANANHPDRDEYRRYEEEFEKQRRHIAERREQMRRRRQMQNPPQRPAHQQQQPPRQEKQQPQQKQQQPQQQQHQQPGAERSSCYGEYECGEGFSDEDNYEKSQQLSSNQGSDQRHGQGQDKRQNRDMEKPQESLIVSDEDESHCYSPEIDTNQLQPQQQSIPLSSQEQKIPAKCATKMQKLPQQPKQQLNSPPTINLGNKFPQNVDRITTIAKSTAPTPGPTPSSAVTSVPAKAIELGKRKSHTVNLAATTTPTKQSKQESILIISLDDDDDEENEVPQQEQRREETALENPIKNIFQKSDGIPGLDLVAAGTGAVTATSESKPNADNNKKIPSLLDVVIDKPGTSPRERESDKAKVTEPLTDTVSNALKDPEFMNNLSQALAQARGREREQQQSNETSEHASNSNNNENNDGRALSFAEWQLKKNSQKSSSQQDNLTDNSSGVSFAPGAGPAFNPDPRPPDGSSPNGPPFEPGAASDGQLMGPNFIDFNSPSGVHFGPKGLPNVPNFRQQGGGPGQASGRLPGPGPFVGGPGRFGRNFGPPGPNNHNLNGPGPNFSGNFRGMGPCHGPGPGPFRQNFCGPNGPGPGQNFESRRQFGGPSANAAEPFDRNFRLAPNIPNKRNFSPGPGPGLNNQNVDGPNLGNNNNHNNNSFSDNPFRRNAGSSGPNFDNKRDGPGFGPRGKGQLNHPKNFGQPRNSFGNAGGSDGAEHIGNTQRPSEPVYRPMQVFDYQNSRNTAAKVIDYGHKSADNSASRVDIGCSGRGPSPGPVTAPDMPNFRPGVTFDYGHASHTATVSSSPTGPGAGLMNRNPNVNTKKKNKKKNKNRQRLLQQQQPQDQNSTTLTGSEVIASERPAAKTEDDLEDISDGEDSLADVSSFESPPPPPKFQMQQPLQSPQQHRKVFPANPQRRILGESPAALFPSTAAANRQIPEQTNASRLEISVPTNENCNTICINEVLLLPGRASRPKRICIILRGPPGCGKSHVARLIKDKELEMGGATPRILSIDDYFIIENDYEEKCPKTGKKIPKKEILYEYDDTMEETYMQYLIKSFKKTLSDNLYDFIIVDCNNNSLRTLNEFYCHAKDSNFVPYIVDMLCDVETCLERNSHQRREEDIRDVLENWCTTPLHYIKLDVSSLLENVVEMEDVADMATDDNADSEQAAPEKAATAATDNEDSNSADAANDCGFLKSKWENDTTVENLARLDGTKRLMEKRKTASMADYLQLDDWEPPTVSADGKKRVRWADIEEKRKQQKMRAIGFVVGQTDWKRMMDPHAGNRALNKTKYIERVKKWR